jgi:hypothetical protein
MDADMMKHMELTPVRAATHADSAKARALVSELRTAIAKYRDTSAAVAGYQMFLPNVKDQRVYHFTNYRRALKEVFRFNADEPTALLYRKGKNGTHSRMFPEITNGKKLPKSLTASSLTVSDCGSWKTPEVIHRLAIALADPTGRRTLEFAHFPGPSYYTTSTSGQTPMRSCQCAKMLMVLLSRSRAATIRPLRLPSRDRHALEVQRWDGDLLS